MKSQKIAVSEATLPQLKAFATTVLGLEVARNATQDIVIGKIREAGYNLDHITVFEEVTPSQRGRTEGSDAKASARVVKTGQDGRERVYYRILIPNEEKPGGEEPVPVGVNGRSMFIPRGQPVEVPEEYVEVLENAEAYVYEPYDGNGLGGLKPPRAVKSYPFSYA